MHECVCWRVCIHDLCGGVCMRELRMPVEFPGTELQAVISSVHEQKTSPLQEQHELFSIAEPPFLSPQVCNFLSTYSILLLYIILYILALLTYSQWILILQK